MNESFYVTVATVSPVLLLGATIAYRGSRNMRVLERGVAWVFLLSCALAAAGSLASLVTALTALRLQEEVPVLVEKGMVMALGALMASSVGPLGTHLYLAMENLWLQSVHDRLKRQSRRLDAESQRKREIIAHLERQVEDKRAQLSQARSRSEPGAPVTGPTRLLAERR